jgi:dienelactone hydrolase
MPEPQSAPGPGAARDRQVAPGPHGYNEARYRAVCVDAEESRPKVDFAELVRRPLVWQPPRADIEVHRDIPYRRDPVLLADLYRPSGDRPVPLVIFVHGEAPGNLLANAKDWGQYRGWGTAIASSGLGAVTFTHRNIDTPRPEDALSDVQALRDTMAARSQEFRLLLDNVALFGVSFGVPLAMHAILRAMIPGLRGGVMFYGPLDLRPLGVSAELAALSPILHLGTSGTSCPTLMVKAAHDSPEINESIDMFVDNAREAGWPVELVIHEDGHHAFDLIDNTVNSEKVMRQTIWFLQHHLLSRT